MADCWLAVYFQHLLLQFHAWTQGEGKRRGVSVYSELAPQALFDSKTRQIVAACPKAISAGVNCGLSTTTAQALMPELQLTEHRQIDRQRLEQWLCQWHYDFSARIWPAIVDDPIAETHRSIAQQTQQLSIWPKETLVLEIGSMQNLFGGLAPFFSTYQQRLEHYGLQAQLALARHPLQAAVLACKPSVIGETSARPPRISTPRQTRYQMGASSVAATTTEDAKANYQHIAEALPENLPITQLPLTDKMQQRLHGIGIVHWQQLQKLPRAELGKRFGQELLTLLLLLEGRMPCQRAAYELPLNFHLSVLLSHDVEFIQGLIFPLSPMLAQLADYLRGRQLAVRQITLTLRFRDQERASLSLQIDYPMGEFRADGLLQLCRLQLERLTLEAPVTELSVWAEHFIEPEIALSSLVDEVQQSQSITLLLAKLQARLGAEQVRYLTQVPHPLPEQATSSLTIEQWPPKKHARSSAKLALRPLWLLREPEPIDENCVRFLRGPERISYCWENVAYSQRDYYVAQHQSGRYCWVFRSHQQLLLHGWMS